MKKYFILLTGILAGISIMIFPSCFKSKYEGPPDTLSYDPKLTVTHTIAQLLARPQGLAISDDITVNGVVVMDDRSGNAYKSIIVQDATAGVEVLLDQTDLYNDYPVGRKVYIKCRGLFLSSDNGNPQLGYMPSKSGSLSPIPSTLIDDYIIKANYPNFVIPDTFTIAELAVATTMHLNTLVAVKNIEFTDEVAGEPYAEPGNLSSATSLAVQDCNGAVAYLRSSGYAKFQSYFTPQGNGTLVGVFTKYNTDVQFLIRDTTDVSFNGIRCSGGPPAQTLFADAFDNMDKWNAVSVEGAETWKIVQYGNPKPCAAISGYSGGNHINEDWLISKAVNLDGYTGYTLSFESAVNYNGNKLSVYISSDYTGNGLPGTATWTALTNAVFADVSGDFMFTKFGDIDLSAYQNQQVYIAFKYTSTSSAAASWELDNVKITGHP